MAFGINGATIEGWNGLFASVQGTCLSEGDWGVTAYLFTDQTTFVLTDQSEFSLVIKQDEVTEINGLITPQMSGLYL